MKQENQVALKYRVIFIILVAAISVISNYYHCFVLSISSLPSLIVNGRMSTKVFFLYGYSICHDCPAGQFLFSLRDSADIMFVVPSDFSEVEVKNLRNVFQVKGDIVKGNAEIEAFLAKIASCKRAGSWRSNVFLELKKDRKIDAIKML